MLDEIEDISRVWAAWPEPAQAMANDLRALFMSMAPEGRPLIESTKWGEPSWRPTKGGTTLRINWRAERPDDLGCFAHCQTDLIERLQALHPEAVRYGPPRAVYLDLHRPTPEHVIKDLAAMAFTYKRVLPK